MRSLFVVLLVSLRVLAQPTEVPTPSPITETSPAGAVAASAALAPEVYPLAWCPITGSALGSMGDPVLLDVQGLSVQLCCAHCQTEAELQVDAIRKTITKALLKRDRADYPLPECVACGQSLPKKPIAWVQGSTLLLLDREECRAGVAEHGGEWARRVREARAARP